MIEIGKCPLCPISDAKVTFKMSEKCQRSFQVFEVLIFLQSDHLSRCTMGIFQNFRNYKQNGFFFHFPI